ncbi:MAG: type IX secretion system membrane protein PorP/SprF [Chlorobi bacterium]|nr:type IX secretion system membrane protein PorP/SprF [Chlorobiota bacterium]
MKKPGPSIKLIFLCLFISLVFPFSGVSQDIHFSQFYNSPETLNPALTGDISYHEFDENLYRVGGNFKNQGASISAPYRTYSFFADASVGARRMKRGQMGFGLLFYNDKAGDGSLQNSSVMLSFAYTQGFNRFNTFRATLGFSVGFVNRTVDVSKLVFDNQWDGVIFNPDLSNGENFASNSVFAFNFNFGGLITYKITRSFILKAGASLSHINKPHISFYDADNRINQKLIVHASANIKTGDNLLIYPGVMYSVQAKASELVLGSNFTLTNRDVQLILGIWYRWNRDFIPLAGLKYHGYQLTISYDVNASPLRTASNYQGGIEISLIMVFRKNYKGIPCSDFE